MDKRKYPTKRDFLDERYGKLYRRLQNQMKNIKLDYQGEMPVVYFNVRDFIKAALEIEDVLNEDKILDDLENKNGR